MSMTASLLQLIKQFTIRLLERMPDVHHQHQAPQGLSPGKIVQQTPLPLPPLKAAGPGIAIARQVHQPHGLIAHREIVEQSGAARSGTGIGQSPATTQGVECAGLAGIGTATERDFSALIGRALREVGGTRQKARLSQPMQWGSHAPSIPKVCGQ